MISLQNISYSIPGRQLLKKVSFQISNGQHVGIVGRNGSGKSTLFKIVQGVLSGDEGKMESAKNWKILSVKQEMPDPHLTPLEFLLSRDEEQLALFQELEGC